jgi:hypothetical protein
VAYTSRVLQNVGAANQPPGFSQFMLTVIPSMQVMMLLLSAPFTAAISWAVRTGLFYGLAVLVGGSRAFWGRVVAMVGWAWVPLFIQYVLLGLLMLVFPQIYSYLAGVPDSTSITAMAESMRQKWHGQVLIYLSPFVIWNLVLCVIGVSEVFRLPTWKAALVVLVPSVAHLLMQAAMYLTGLTIMDAMSGMPGTVPTVPNGPGPGR